MPQQNTLQSISTFDLKPVYISLGLPKSTFGVHEERPAMGPFQAALDGGTHYPDCVWFFRGEDCYRFNVKQGEFEYGLERIAEAWGGATCPLLFASGIDAAVWGGPSYPDLVYFFKDTLFIRYVVSSGKVDVAPTLMTDGWFSARGTWLSNGPGATLHAIETEYKGMLHFFKGAEYLRHDLNNGHAAAGPMPITQQWSLPEPFTQGIDLAFYGTGSESEKIYFFKGDQYLLYDLKTRRAERVSSIESRFPALARYIERPQLFLVEHYQLNTYVGPSEAGELVETLSIPGHTKKSVLLVTEVTETSTTAIHQTLMQSQDEMVEHNFYEQMKTQNEQSGSRERYDYHLDASFHGDASASSPWGGEVNANLKAQGGTNDVRNSFSEAAFGTLQSQLNTTARQVKQQVFSSDQQYQRTEHTMRMEEETIDNTTSDRLLIYEYHQQRQSYLTLLILRQEQIAFSDGLSSLEKVEMSQMDSLLSKYIPRQQDRDEVRQLIIGELMTIDDYQGTPRAVLKEISLTTHSTGRQDIKVYQFDPTLKSTYAITNPDGSEQVIVVNGLVRGDHLWKVPTYTMIPIEKA
jgi:Hemopexin